MAAQRWPRSGNAGRTAGARSGDAALSRGCNACRAHYRRGVGGASAYRGGASAIRDTNRDIPGTLELTR